LNLNELSYISNSKCACNNVPDYSIKSLIISKELTRTLMETSPTDKEQSPYNEEADPNSAAFTNRSQCNISKS
jgi:hypothetical protein